MGHILRGATLAAAFLASVSLASAAELITDGGFTNGLIGWKKDSKQVDAATDVPYKDHAGGTGSSIFSFAAFGGGNKIGGSIQQTFATVIGQVYTFSFDYMGFGSPGGNAQTLAFSVGDIIDSVTVGSAQLTTSFDTALNHYTGSFEATDTSTTLLFRDKSLSSVNADMLITNVSVNSAVAVPGPEAGAGLGALALGGMAFWARRRRSGSSAAI